VWNVEPRVPPRPCRLATARVSHPSPTVLITSAVGEAFRQPD
jgi:hypothetical protein